MTTEIVHRRRRPATSCALCRKRRIKCDRQRPCGHCLKTQNRQCVYDSDIGRGTHQSGVVSQSSSTAEPGPVSRLLPSEDGAGQTAPTVGTETNAQPIETQVSLQTPAEPHQEPQQQDASSSDFEAFSSSIGGTWYVHNENSPRQAIRGMTHKTRQLGQSHWMNVAGLFRDMFMDIEALIRESSCPVRENLQKCKVLAQTIKLQRRPAWPPAPSQLPPKALADDLVECYMRTSESVYRVLHVPSFHKEYHSLWRADAKPDPAFMTLVKLVLAIGAAGYDDDFSLRKSAIHWVYEAHLWLADPCTKHRLNLLGLRIHVLTLIARGIVGVDGDAVYISAGDLLRRAVSMGLHVEKPVNAPRYPVMATEIRRRMWSTVLEICVQSSLASGGPPLLAMDDFDTEPPRNFDDDQLWADDPVPKPAGEFTGVSFSLALRKTFPMRLAIVRLINGPNASSAYEDILRLDRELRAAYRTISHAFQAHKSKNAAFGPSQFGLQLMDFLMQAFLTSLHMPFSNPYLNPTALAYSRRVVVESALKIWYILRPSANEAFSYSRDHTTTPSSSSSAAASCISRFGTCGPGIFRVAGMQAALVVALELRTQIQEDERLESTPIRPDLLAVLRDAQKWSLDRISIGDTNIKSYQMFSMIWAQINGMMQKLGKDGILQSVLQAAIDAETVAIPMLERVAHSQAGQPAEAVLTSDPASAETDWEISWRDDLFDITNIESMSWVLNDGNTQVSMW